MRVHTARLSLFLSFLLAKKKNYKNPPVANLSGLDIHRPHGCTLSLSLEYWKQFGLRISTLLLIDARRPVLYIGETKEPKKKEGI